MYYRSNKSNRLVFNETVVSAITNGLESSPAGDNRREALRACLKSLDEDQRRLIDMRYGAAMPIASISEQLNRTQVALKTALHRLRAKLEHCIQRRITQEEMAR
jgi:RNA polymerase sigma factor (sigma-70 family)